MILVDTSVWVDHLKDGAPMLAALLAQEEVLTHPHVIGELALGSFRERRRVFQFLSALPEAVTASDAEVLRFIEGQQLWGSGIGYVDAHLLASARLSFARLLTRDRKLESAARRLGLSAVPLH